MKKLLAVLLLLVVYPAYSQDYTYSQVQQVPLQYINQSGGTNAALGDDGMETDIKIGFDFEFYGNIFNTVSISNNGFITFTGVDSMCCNGFELPAFYMDNSIIALWTDLISTNNMNPYYKSYAVDGNRAFTVGWYNTLEFYNPNYTNTFEITLYEGSNTILINYENLNVYGHSLTAGIQGTNGQYEQIYYGNSTQALANSAYLFEYTPATPPEPETPIAPDCTVNPADPSCIINTNISAPILLAEDNNEDTPTELVEQQEVMGGEAPNLESLLAEKEEEVTIEEKQEIKDEIEANILEQVLATTETSAEEKDKDRSKGLIEDTETVATTNTQTVEETVANNTQTVVEVQNETVENKVDVEETESSVVAVETTETSVETTVEETQPIELPVFVQNTQESVIENITIESFVEDGTITEEQIVQNNIEQSITMDQEQTTELVNNVIEQSENEVVELANILSKSTEQKTFEEQVDDEQLTMAYVQPGTNIFNTTINVEPNMADKEIAGVLNNTEEKSDAEKRADEIVAANKDQQEEISKNYMEADQTGLIGAITDGTDVSSYRTAMIPELSVWYKPEDIYKNVKYNDNKRGMYFLEKGNTDTYKQMVDEQYK